MANRYVWIGIAAGVFFAGIGIGYAIFVNTYTPPWMNPNSPQFSQMMAQNPQMINTMMQNQASRQQMMTAMMNDPAARQQMMQDQQFMQQMMSDPQFSQQMLQRMQQNQQFMQNTMNSMMNDPTVNQQMMGMMMQNQQFMQQWMSNSQFQQNWMYPHMMQNWRMGPGMGPGMMMGGSMMNYGINPTTSPAVMTDKVVIPDDAWNPRLADPYQPLRIEVQAGTTVTWTNEDSVVHTVTDVDNRFDSQLIEPGGSWSYTFDDEGEYVYYCTIHPWMKGSVKVG